MLMALFLLPLEDGRALAAGEGQADSERQICVLAAPDPIAARAAIAAPNWNCQPSKADARFDHSWVRIPAELLPAENAVLVGEAMAMKGLHLARESRDGSVQQRTVSARDIAQNWTTGTRFSLPISDLAGAGPLYVRVDEPLGPEIALGMSAMSAQAEATTRRGSLVLLGMVLGILLLTSAISGFMAAALKQRFAALHFVFSMLLCVYVATSGSLVFLVFPELTLWTRSVIAYASIAWAIAMLAPFVMSFFERDAISPTMRRLAVATGLLAFTAGFYLPLGAWLGVNLRGAFNLAFVPGTLVTVVIVAAALRRGSRAARLFLLAWSIPFAFSAERLVRNLGFYSLPPIADFGFYLALAVQGAALTLAVGWRINDLRRERDAALATQRRFEREARIDALTGLHNRRDYSLREWSEDEALALLDIDRFKTINDTYGHDTGDSVLVAIGGHLARAVSEGRLVGAWRLGGEEFAVVLQDRTIGAAAIRLDQLRRRIPFCIDSEVPGLEHPVTASAGLVLVGTDGPAECYRRADRLLYAAKRSGRDRLSFEEETTSARAASDDQLNRSRKVS